MAIHVSHQKGLLATRTQGSFDILYHFTYPLDAGLQFNHAHPDLRVIRLGTDRVRFPEHLLGEKIKRPTITCLFSHDIRKLGNVTL